MSITIFGDEAGFTGVDLLNLEQPIFCYSTVCIDEQYAKSIVLDIRQKFKLQATMTELKGSKIVKRKDSIKILEYLLSKIKGDFLITYAIKDYIVCCELFEYIYEPVLANVSSFLYGNHFHLFVSNMLYLMYKAGEKDAVDLFDDIFNYLRWGDISKLRILFKKKRLDSATTPIKEILAFALKHKTKILDEFRADPQAKIDIPPWTLDLTVTCIHTMLAKWGETNPEIKFVYDESKALESDFAQEVFKSMLHRKGPSIKISIGAEPVSITYNLSEMPQKRTSTESEAIQIADLLVSFFYHGQTNRTQKGKDILSQFSSYSDKILPIGPILGVIDPSQKLPNVNAQLLIELSKISSKNLSDKAIVPRLYSSLFILTELYT